MSWGDIFPVLDNALVEEFRTQATPEDRAELREWFGVKRIFNRQPEKRHIVSSCFFWRHVNGADPELPAPTRERLAEARRLGLVKRFAPWDTYLEPVFLRGADAAKKHPDVCFRIYLAGDLEFLAADFVRLGWEVRLMRSGSLRYCPGGFWRFLALGERGKWVTVIDTDRISVADGDIARTRFIERLGLGLWRVPGYYNAEPREQVRYRPILGGHFGARGGLAVRTLIEAFVWHTRRGTMPATAKVPGLGERPIQFARWPDYGLDEWWLLAALYPRLARRGVLTFAPADARSPFLPADLEFATWANRKSEVIYV